MMIDATIIFVILLSLLSYALITKKKDFLQETIIAFLISLLWVWQSGLYDYTDGNNILLFTINLSPVLMWTAALVAIKEIAEMLKGKNRWPKIIGIWLGGLFIVEYIGYHILQIQLNNTLPPLYFNVLHIPMWALWWYLSAGPLFVYLTDSIS